MKKFNHMLIVGLLLSPFAHAADFSLDRCAGCHGANMDGSPFGSFRTPVFLDREEIIKTMKGYKDGTYGGEFKDSMRTAIHDLNDADFVKIADAIEKLAKKDEVQKKRKAGYQDFIVKRAEDDSAAAAAAKAAAAKAEKEAAEKARQKSMDDLESATSLLY